MGGDRRTQPVQPPPDALGHLCDAPLIQPSVLLSPNQRALVASLVKGTPSALTQPLPPAHPGQPCGPKFSSHSAPTERGEAGEEKRPGGK